MTTDTITQRVDELGWYHTLELPGGQVTEGMFDLRNQMHHYGLPERMDGMRALDVGTWDGFWAFEMERRGAEVIALDLDDERDLDWPPAAAARRCSRTRRAAPASGSRRSCSTRRSSA